MEIVFLIIALLVTLTTIYMFGRVLFTHKGLIKAYKTSEFLGLIHILIGSFLIIIIFVGLCAFNNTFWHLPYLTL